MASKSPTELTLAEMRKRGCTVAVVEKWNPYARIRQDLFGVIDVLCLSPDGQTIAVQTTSRSNIASRLRKIADAENISAMRACGWKIVVHGWDKHEGSFRLKEVDVS